MPNDTVVTLQEVNEIVSRRMNSAVLKEEVVAGSTLARQLALNFGNLDFTEADSQNFVWGVSIWGHSRI